MTQVPVDDLRNRALRVAARAEIEDVRLFEVKSNVVELPDRPTGLSYTMASDVQVQYLPEEDGLIAAGEYKVTIREAEQDTTDDAVSDDPKTILDLEFTMAMLFSVEVREGDEPFTETELDAFAKTTGQFALHPYARELVADLTGRMGLPQLHIGMLKLHLDAPNEAAK
jgi:preprotein translocase subunit SecB